MKNTRSIFAVLVIAIVGLALAGCNCKQNCKPQIKLGIEVLEEQGFKILEGKRVGLCTNATGIDQDFRSTLDILHQAPNVNLVAAYGPEHGVRGNIHAGDHVDDEIDPKTGVKMYSLFGKTRRPTKEMMDEIDVMVYDIQDNGCRSFTYISTMGMLMEACAAYDKELVVLDRPNPCGGLKIEGNLAEDDYISFISQFKIPYLYGQTCGELALMLNGERMLGELTGSPNPNLPYGSDKQCQLTVIPMEGWTRDMNWEETGLPWVVASPHIPHGESSYFYPATGIMGELYYFSIGVGYTLPFELMGTPWLSADTLADNLNARGVPGVHFRPIYFKPYYSSFKGEQCQGVQIHITDFDAAPLSALQFIIVDEIHKMYPDFNVFEKSDSSRYNMFDKACGTGYIREKFAERFLWDDIKDYWNKDVEAYRALSSKYYLYK